MEKRQFDLRDKKCCLLAWPNRKNLFANFDLNNSSVPNGPTNILYELSFNKKTDNRSG
ncbi:MAG: hypothetical protein ACLVJ7_02625 [Acutalibacteraceae bacterium]